LEKYTSFLCCRTTAKINFLYLKAKQKFCPCKQLLLLFLLKAERSVLVDANLANQLRYNLKFCANWLESTVWISGDGRLIFKQI
jgi:hypothetical protein